MKKRIIQALFLLICILGMFTGCDQASSLPVIVGSVKGYNRELVTLILTGAVGRIHSSYSENESLSLDSNIVCIVDESDIEDTTLLITLSDWIADDGTAISGFLNVDVRYYSSTGNISSIKIRPATLYFNRTSAGYQAEVFDGDDSTSAFTSNSEVFMCTSLIIDGKTFIFNTSMYT